MTREDFLEALKWSLIAAVMVALWCGVIAVRKARADEPAQGIRPVWVIVVYATQKEKLVSITEYLFYSRRKCEESAVRVKQELELQIVPDCYLRWVGDRKETGQGGEM